MTTQTTTEAAKVNPATDPKLIYPLDQAAQLFQQCRTKAFYEYFVDHRNIPIEILNQFQIGYSPPWLHSAIPELQWGPFITTKLLTTRKGSEAPFGNLYSFPYLDQNGHVISFQFRNTQDDEDGTTRYWNFPAQRKISCPPYSIVKPLVYSHPSYGDNRVITLVEGPIDVFRCVQAKLPNPQAVCGLAFNSKQLLKSFRGKRVYLMLDWDGEGRRKTFQVAMDYLTDPDRHWVDLIIINGPWQIGKDPADLSEKELKVIFEKDRITPLTYIKRWIEKGIDTGDKGQLMMAQQLLSSQNISDSLLLD